MEVLLPFPTLVDENAECAYLIEIATQQISHVLHDIQVVSELTVLGYTTLPSELPHRCRVEYLVFLGSRLGNIEL